MAVYQDLRGKWQVSIDGLCAATAVLPGTLDENHIGFPDTGGRPWHPDETLGNGAAFKKTGCILTRLTRNYSFEGPARYTRTVTIEKGAHQRIFLEAERSRELTLTLNGRAVPASVPGSLSTPYVFEVTDFVHPGENHCTLCCDNAYPSWPHNAIVNSSAATDETQTNWNGIIGDLRLRYEKENFISLVSVYPGPKTLDVMVEVDCRSAFAGTLSVCSTALAGAAEKTVSCSVGRNLIALKDLPIASQAEVWDEDAGVLHRLHVRIPGMEEKTVSFGLRTIGNRKGKLALNGRILFLRSETNCCVFPETGHMPMTVEAWKQLLSVYRAYGVNCMRFHSHCPPDAAFTAADEMGMLMQPELSHWNPKNAFEDDKSWRYYQLELTQILRCYANHPSFVMLTMGNELCSGALGHRRMTLLVKMAGQIDGSRMYAVGSNNFCSKSIGPDPTSDFFTAANSYETPLRGTSAMMTGHINQNAPNTRTDYQQAVAEIREEFSGPIFGFEVGQYEILPDFDELHCYHGVTSPMNYLDIRRRAEAEGFGADWKKRVEATGELSLLSYREEIESVLRTEAYTGLSLLGLQDFPGQGTALVGMLNAHLQPKPFSFASPERFRRFFSDLVPLVLLDKYTYTVHETLRAEIKIANYTKSHLNTTCTVRLTQGDRTLNEQCLPGVFPCGALTAAGEIAFPLEGIPAPEKLTLEVSLAGAINDYPIWVYPDIRCSLPDTVVVARSAKEAFPALKAGSTVFLTPKADVQSFPASIPAQFTTDFWSVGTFSKQSGFMGCMMDPQHPVFSQFPTEFHSNWQWWRMCRGRGMILPKGLTSIVTALDCYARMRNMGMLLEARVGDARLMISSMGLMEHLDAPEVRMLLHSILQYMAGSDFHPAQEISYETLEKILGSSPSNAR